MKKKNIIISLIIILLLICLIIMVLCFGNNKEVKYDYTNKIFVANPYIENDVETVAYVFTKSGNYFYFIDQYDEHCDLRSKSGHWAEKENKIYVKYDYAIYFDGGNFVETDDTSYFGIRRLDYDIVKRSYPYDANLIFSINKGKPNDDYKDYLIINDIEYYPRYEYETEEELYKKLEEMYGEAFTMLIDDNIEIKEEETEIIENDI